MAHNRRHRHPACRHTKTRHAQLVRSIKPRCLELLRDSTLFLNLGASVATILAGYHQYHAFKRALSATIRATAPTGDRGESAQPRTFRTAARAYSSPTAPGKSSDNQRWSTPSSWSSPTETT